MITSKKYNNIVIYRREDMDITVELIKSYKYETTGKIDEKRVLFSGNYVILYCIEHCVKIFNSC